MPPSFPGNLRQPPQRQAARSADAQDTAASPSIVLADPDGQRRLLIRYALEGGGHSVVEAASAAECIALLHARHVSLLVLAAQLLAPGPYALAWLRREPAARHLPVLALTDAAMSARACIAGGADAALPHDAAPRELVSRVAELLADPAAGAPRLLRAGPLEMDCAERLVFADGSVCALSPCEFRVLEFLMRHPNRVLTREEILEAAWDRNDLPKARAVDVYIRRLRASLGPQHGALIMTVRPVGYRLLIG